MPNTLESPDKRLWAITGGNSSSEPMIYNSVPINTGKSPNILSKLDQTEEFRV